MQWWSNPSARSHLEAWVNIWVRSAGLALVLAGWLLVGVGERERGLVMAVFLSLFIFCARVQTTIQCGELIRHTATEHDPDHL